MGKGGGVLINGSIHRIRLLGRKKGQATYIAPLRPATLASFLTWGVHQELVVRLALKGAKVQLQARFARG